MLFMVGLNDEIIEPSNSVDLYIKAKEPKALWIVEGAGHVECIHLPQVKADLLSTMDTALDGRIPFNSEMHFYEQNSMDR